MGYLHLYIGDGKGKTSASVGLAVRAQGSGMRVLFAQFLKSSETGELEGLKLLQIPVLRNQKAYGFTWTLDSTEKESLRQEQNERLEQILEILADRERDLIVLDELLGALESDTVSETLVRRIAGDASDCEIVMTGRHAPDWLRQRADYITNMQKEKHPFDQGIPARRGIEF